MSINFTANYIKPVEINKRYYKKYIPKKVALVELDYNNPKDIHAIYNTSWDWDNSYTAFVYDDMRKANSGRMDTKGFHVYALTTQKEDYHKLKSSKMLGVIEVFDEKKQCKVETLQTNPRYIKNKVENPKPLYKNIGKELLSFIKQKFTPKDISLTPVKPAVKFYEKQGFKIGYGTYGNQMVYSNKF